MSEFNEITQSIQSPAQDVPFQASTETVEIDRECSEFQSLMAVRIRDGEDLQSYPHMLTCERCRALVRDLELIAEVARKYFQEPNEEIEPREDVWTKIVKAIESNDTNSLELTSEA